MNVQSAAEKVVRITYCILSNVFQQILLMWLLRKPSFIMYISIISLVSFHIHFLWLKFEVKFKI